MHVIVLEVIGCDLKYWRRCCFLRTWHQMKNMSCVFLTCLFCQPDSSLSLWNRTSRHVYSRSIHWTILQWTKTTTKIWTLLLCALELFSFILTINGSIPHSILWITHEILEAVVLSLCYSTSSLITSNFSRSELAWKLLSSQLSKASLIFEFRDSLWYYRCIFIL